MLMEELIESMDPEISLLVLKLGYNLLKEHLLNRLC